MQAARARAESQGRKAKVRGYILCFDLLGFVLLRRRGLGMCAEGPWGSHGRENDRGFC